MFCCRQQMSAQPSSFSRNCTNTPPGARAHYLWVLWPFVVSQECHFGESQADVAVTAPQDTPSAANTGAVPGPPVSLPRARGLALEHVRLGQNTEGLGAWIIGV